MALLGLLYLSTLVTGRPSDVPHLNKFTSQVSGIYKYSRGQGRQRVLSYERTVAKSMSRRAVLTPSKEAVGRVGGSIATSF